MRTISELLTILRDNADVGYKGISSGLCYESHRIFRYGLISDFEYEYLNDYINENIPVRIGSAYGWPIGEWQPRLEWLNQHIELNK